MIEDELRAAFARHEHLTPAAAPVLTRIQQGYRQRRQRRTVLRSAGVVGLVALALTGPALAIPMGSRNLIGTVPALTPGPLNFLLLGVDRAKGESPVRSDTVIMVHIPASRDTAYLVSVARDALVAIPGHGTEKLNAAYAFGGFGLTSRTLTQLTGVRFDGGAVVDMDGLGRLIDTIGGLDLYVDEKVTSIHLGYTRDGRQRAPFEILAPGGQLRPVKGVTPQVYQVGYQHLTGTQVVDYARQRYLLAKGDGDEGRQRHVRQVFAAVLRTLRSTGTFTDPVRASRFLAAVGRSVTVDTGDLAIDQLIGGLRGISEPVGIQVPVRFGDRAGEVRLTADATSLFAALTSDDLADWVAAHPSAVAPVRGP